MKDKLNFSFINVLVVGDLMLDKNVLGYSNRLSPEAPVPVFIPDGQENFLGGAGNVVRNLFDLGANVKCVGIVGDDNGGDEIIKISNTLNPNILKNIVIAQEHQTTIKERIYLGKKQILRIDHEENINSKYDQIILEKCDQLIASSDILILSDYDKGVLSSNVLHSLVQKAKELNIPTIVDPKKTDFSHYSGSNIITPNLYEFKKATANFDQSLTKHEKAKMLAEQNDFEHIVITEGAEGMTVLGKNYKTTSLSTNKVSEADVTGAGDTVIATLSLVYALTKDIIFSAKIANLAANYVVKQLGTSSIDIEKLNTLIESKKKIR